MVLTIIALTWIASGLAAWVQTLDQPPRNWPELLAFWLPFFVLIGPLYWGAAVATRSSRS
jgi:hypothetical protein